MVSFWSIEPKKCQAPKRVLVPLYLVKTVEIEDKQIKSLDSVRSISFDYVRKSNGRSSWILMDFQSVQFFEFDVFTLKKHQGGAVTWQVR